LWNFANILSKFSLFSQMKNSAKAFCNCFSIYQNIISEDFKKKIGILQN
jgi:hypothetical protein